MKTKFLALFYLVSITAIAQKDSTFTESPITLETKTCKIYGTLCMPLNAKIPVPVAIIIAGSGPTDRNGNSPKFGLKTDAYKQLAHKLSEAGVATLRYDKRAIGESKVDNLNEADLRFEDYINDAKAWVELLKADKRFSKVIIMGHSEGSLIGMVAASKDVAGYISIAGAGQRADKILKQQLSGLPTGLKDTAYTILDSLVAGKTTEHVPAALFAMFHANVQPYEISWFKYDPQVEITKLKIPILIIQGTTDIQVGVDDAVRLSKADPAAKLDTIAGMNHILKQAPKDKQANVATYYDPSLPIDAKLVTDIEEFINKK